MRSVSFDNPVSRSTAAIGSDGPVGARSPAGESRRERAEWRLDKINLLRDSVLDKRLTQGTDSLTIGREGIRPIAPRWRAQEFAEMKTSLDVRILRPRRRSLAGVA